MRFDGLTVAHDLDLVFDVEGHAHRPAKRDLLPGQSADDRVLHVPEVIRDLGVDEARELHAALRERGLQLVAVEHVRGERRLHVHDVDLALLEREQPRLILFDDAHFDAADQGHLLALHLRGDAFVLGFGPRLEIPDEAAIARIRLEDDLRRADPVLEEIWSGADRIRHRAARFVGVLLDHFARHRGSRLVRQHERQVVVGLLQADPQRMAVDGLEPGDLLVVVELRVFLRRIRELVEADDLVLDQPCPRGAQLGIDEALQ